MTDAELLKALREAREALMRSAPDAPPHGDRQVTGWRAEHSPICGVYYARCGMSAPCGCGLGGPGRLPCDCGLEDLHMALGLAAPRLDVEESA